MWDHRSQRFFAAASPGSAAGSGKTQGLKHLLLSWPQSFRGQLEDAHSVSLPGPVFSLHPIFSSAAVSENTYQAVADSRSAEESMPMPAEPQPQEAVAPEQEADNSGQAQAPLTEQAWVREWVEGASRAARDAPESAQAPDEEASTSGRGQSAAESSCPGVFVVHTNGTVGLDTLYTRWGHLSLL